MYSLFQWESDFVSVNNNSFLMSQWKDTALKHEKIPIFCVCGDVIIIIYDLVSVISICIDFSKIIVYFSW